MASQADDKENSPIIESAGGENSSVPAVHKGQKGWKTGGELSKSTKTVWKERDDKILVETLLKEWEGCQSDSGFKPVSWIAYAEALEDSEDVSGGIVKTMPLGVRCGYAHSHSADYYNADSMDLAQKGFWWLQEQSGFGWDSTTSKVTVPNDFWEKYL